MNISIEQYKKDGYLLLKNFFSTELIQKIQQEATAVFINQFIALKYLSEEEASNLSNDDFNAYLFQLYRENLSCIINCGKQVQHLISLHQLSLDQKITTLLAQVGIKSPIISTRPVLFFNHPKLAKEEVYYKVQAHQDWRSMQGSLNSVVIWVPLVNVTKDIGPLSVLPGSHLKGLQTSHLQNSFGMVTLSNEDRKKMISVEVEQGDILLFSSFLIHESGDNISNTPRWSCHFRYNDLLDPSFIARNYPHAYIYKPVSDLLTPNFPITKEVQNIFKK